MCFGCRRQARHHQIQWNEKHRLLDDEPQMIPNPCFLDSGKGQRSELRLLNMRSNFTVKTSWHFTLDIQHPLSLSKKKTIKISLILPAVCAFGTCREVKQWVYCNDTVNVFNCFHSDTTWAADKNTKGKNAQRNASIITRTVNGMKWPWIRQVLSNVFVEHYFPFNLNNNQIQPLEGPQGAALTMSRQSRHLALPLSLCLKPY